MFSLGTKVQDVLLGHPTSSCKLLVEDHLEFPRVVRQHRGVD